MVGQRTDPRASVAEVQSYSERSQLEVEGIRLYIPWRKNHHEIPNKTESTLIQAKLSYKPAMAERNLDKSFSDIPEGGSFGQAIYREF